MGWEPDSVLILCELWELFGLQFPRNYSFPILCPAPGSFTLCVYRLIAKVSKGPLYRFLDLFLCKTPFSPLFRIPVTSTQEDHQALFHFPFLSHCQEFVSKRKGNYTVHLILFPSLRHHSTALPITHYLKKVLHFFSQII